MAQDVERNGCFADDAEGHYADMAEETWYVDIPDKDFLRTQDSPFFNVDTFSTREEAIAFAQEHFGADDEGRVKLVS